MAIVRNAAGKIIGKKFTVARLERAANENRGFCVACGASKGECETDARAYKCESCGLPTVFGAEELALMGHVKGS
jgi:tRNA(Ile2) C34 agmatinyltransferase TiaS